jgi:hypothetical protein
VKVSQDFYRNFTGINSISRKNAGFKKISRILNGLKMHCSVSLNKHTSCSFHLLTKHTNYNQNALPHPCLFSICQLLSFAAQFHRAKYNLQLAACQAYITYAAMSDLVT